MKNIIPNMKKHTEQGNSQLDTVEEQMSKLENRAIKTIPNKTQRKKIEKRLSLIETSMENLKSYS